MRIFPTIRDALANSRHVAQAPLAWNPADHVLSRFGFGPSASGRAYVAVRGVDAWYGRQVALGAALRGYAGHLGVAAQGPLLGRSPWDVRQWLAAQGNEYGWTAMDQLTRVTLGLQAWSEAQLYEALVDFFSNHLAVANHNGDVWNTRHAYDRDVIRRHAMGSFTDMLLASARHPAMLAYLNLAESTKSHVNENYGRELLELHTVGLVYREQDVTAAARLLTGRGIDAYSNYTYRPDRHWVGPVQVLGFTTPNASTADGEGGGDALLRYLASHPATAQRLAQRLCVRFVSDRPSGTLVAAVARAYLAGGTQVLPMVQTILRSDEFWQSRGAKVRRPTENLIATLRVLGTVPTDMAKALETLHWMTADAGNAPLDWPAPDGYPDLARSWRSSSTLVRTWEYHLGFADGWWDGFATPRNTSLYGRPPRSSGDAIDLLTRRLTGQPWTAAHRAALQTFLGEPASTPLATSSLRWNLNALIGVILDGPHHALR